MEKQWGEDSGIAGSSLANTNAADDSGSRPAVGQVGDPVRFPINAKTAAYDTRSNNGIGPVASTIAPSSRLLGSCKD